jgi:hypothetical protein
MKEHMLEAVKRRKFTKQYESDSDGEHAEGQGSEIGDQELAPSSGMSKTTGSHERDALLGHPSAHPALKDTRPADLQGETQLGEEQGFDKEMGHVSAPANSKNLFHDPKVDTHDPVDLNRHRNMAGDGSNPKYDKMGVDEHTDVRKQSSKLAGVNARKGEGLKDKERSFVKSKMDISSPKASSDREAGMDASGVVGDNSMQKGFKAPFSKVNRSGDKSQGWDQDSEGPNAKGAMYAEGGESDHDGDEEGSSMKPRMTGLKGARAKLDGFLSKMKKS